MNIILANSICSQNAGPPTIPVDLIFYKAMLSSLDVSIFDLNLEIYKELQYDYTAYYFLNAIFGGYIVSYHDADALPFNEYFFEALPTLELLLTMIFSEADIEKELYTVCKCYGIPYQRAREVLLQFKTFIEKSAVKIYNADIIILNQPSPASVFPALLLGVYLRKLNEKIIIIGIGKQINIPEVYGLALSLKAIDKVVPDDWFSIKNIIPLRDSINEPSADIVPDFTKFFSNDYPLYYGLKIAPYEASYGCPYRCNFCSGRLLWDYQGSIQDTYVKKPLKQVLTEINAISNGLTLSGVTFNDCTLNIEPEYSIAFLSQLESTGLLFSGSTRIDLLNERIIELLQRAHFTNLIVGLETVSNSSLEIFRKEGRNYSEQAWKTILLLYKAGIIPQINLLFAHPYETLENVKNSIHAIIDFAEHLDSKGIPFYYIYSGQVILSYPSEIYFRVLNDSDFKIIYHWVPERLESKVPLEVRHYIEKIPYKAVKKSSDEAKKYNKNEMCLRIQELESKDQQKITHFKVAGMLQHRNLIFKSWQERNVLIQYRKERIPVDDIANLSIGSIMRQLITNQSITINTLAQRIDGNARELLVQILLTLSMMGIISFSGGDMK